MQLFRARQLAGLLAVVSLAAACGASETAGSDSIAPISPSTSGTSITSDTTTLDPVNSVPVNSDDVESVGVARWVTADVGVGNIDGPTPMVVHDGRVWVARGSFEGDGPITVSEVDGNQVTDHVLDFDDYTQTLDVASTPLGLMVAVAGSKDRRPTIWSIDDNGVWSSVVVAERAIDPSGITWVGGRLLMSGTERVGFAPVNDGDSESDIRDGSNFAAVLFESVDGMSWTEIGLDGIGLDPRGNTLGAITIDGDRLVAMSQVADGESSRSAMFESVDDGLTWAPASDRGTAPNLLGHSGESLVGSGASDGGEDNGSGSDVVVSRDGEWRAVDALAVTGPVSYPSSYLLASGPVALFATSVNRPVEYCYDNPDDCGSGGSAALLVRPDGSAAAIDLSALAPGASASVLSAAFTDSGDVHLFVAIDDRLVVATWTTAAGGLDTLPMSAPFGPAEAQGPPLISWEAAVEIGEMYRFPLGVHCGPDVLGGFNGLNWWIVGEPTAAYQGAKVQSGEVLLGEIHVMSNELIEYRIGDDLIATYAPRDEEFPGCM